MDTDVLVRNASVFDGSGGPAITCDVGIRGERIETVGDLSKATARLVIDGTGLAIAPGFIDTHTHSDVSWSLGADHREVVTAGVLQGVTTEICGNCGFSPFPLLSERREDVERFLRPLLGDVPMAWPDLLAFSAAARQAGLFANLAPLIGHGTLRAGLLGFEDRVPRENEVAI